VWAGFGQPASLLSLPGPTEKGKEKEKEKKKRSGLAA